MKVLIIHIAPAGDVIFSTPLIRALKVQLDDAEIYYLTSSQGALVLIENPYVDKICELKHPRFKTLLELGRLGFDYIVDLKSSFNPLVEKILLKGKIQRMPSRKWKQWLMVNLKINKLPFKHIVDLYFEAVRDLHVKKDDLGLDYFIPSKDEVPEEWLPLEFQKGFVVVCLNASYATRKLPVSRIIELCDKINKPVILLGNISDASDGQTISNFFERTTISQAWEAGLKELNKKTIVYNACGKFNLHQMASVIKQARYVFAFDSDFIPIASAFKKEIFSIWGNTILLFGRYPYHTRFTVFENTKAACRPCSTKGFSACPRKHFKCMNDIVFDFYIG